MYGTVPVTGSGESADAWAVEVIRTNGADLLSYLARRTSPPADAADVLGNVLVVIWKRRKDLPQTTAEARMWSFGIARNALRDYRRHGIRQTALADALRDKLAQRINLEHDSEPLEAASRAERREHVRAAIARLTKLDRDLIILVHWDDFTLAQSATLLGMNPSTARTRYARARQRLAAELADHSERRSHSARRPPFALPRHVEDQPESPI